MKNWKTSLSFILTALTWALGHKTDIIPLVPSRYLPLANAAFMVGVIVSGLLTKDAGNRAPAQPPG